jgi:hypothetical protein
VFGSKKSERKLKALRDPLAYQSKKKAPEVKGYMGYQFPVEKQLQNIQLLGAINSTSALNSSDSYWLFGLFLGVARPMKIPLDSAKWLLEYATKQQLKVFGSNKHFLRASILFGQGVNRIFLYH